MVDTLKQLLEIISKYSPDEKDIVSKLPTEISSLIFRHLDDVSLRNASRFSNYWKLIMKCDPVLRERLKRVSAKPDIVVLYKKINGFLVKTICYPKQNLKNACRKSKKICVKKNEKRKGDLNVSAPAKKMRLL